MQLSDLILIDFFYSLYHNIIEYLVNPFFKNNIVYFLILLRHAGGIRALFEKRLSCPLCCPSRLSTVIPGGYGTIG